MIRLFLLNSISLSRRTCGSVDETMHHSKLDPLRVSDILSRRAIRTVRVYVFV